MSEKQIIKFGDICREVKLTTQDPAADGYDRYIGLEHLDSSSLKINRWGIIAEDKPSFNRVFKKGHILFGKRRPYLKKAAIAEFDGVCSSDIIVIEPKSHSQLEVIELVIQFNGFWDWAVKTSSGSLSPRTKFSAIKEFSIPFSLTKLNKTGSIVKKINCTSSKLDEFSEAVAKLKSAFLEKEFWSFYHNKNYGRSE